MRFLKIERRGSVCPGPKGPPRGVVAAGLLLGALLSGSARGNPLTGDFVDMRLSVNATDENIRAVPGDRVPSIPGFRIGQPIPRWATLFFDNYDTRYAGFENMSNLVLYKKVSRGDFDAEAGLVIRYFELEDAGLNATTFSDNGSYIKLTHWFDPKRYSKTNLSLTAFPLSSDRFRLGYSYKISYGGAPIFFKGNPDNPYAGNIQNPYPDPGLKVQLSASKYYAFLGAESSMMLNKKVNEITPMWGILTGGGYDLLRDLFRAPHSGLRLEANGGYFFRGINPKQELLDDTADFPNGAPINFLGGTFQWTLHDGVPVGRSVDFALYQNDPTSLERIFVPEVYPGGLQWLVSSEMTYTAESLQDPDHPTSTVMQPGKAGDVNIRVKYNFWRLHMDLNYQDLAFVLLDTPNFPPYVAFSSTAGVQPEYFVAAGADYHFERQNVTAGLSLGVQRPATYSGATPLALLGNQPDPNVIPLNTTEVIRGEGLIDILPPGTNATLIYAAEGSATWFFNDYFDLVAQLLFSVDNNITQLVRQNNDPNSPFTRGFIDPYQVGFNMALQVKL